MDTAAENSISVLGRELLLVEVGSGAETHLAAVTDGPGRAADHQGDQIEPADGRWNFSSLCGRTWHRMAAGADDRLPLWRHPASAPTCRRCLRILDAWFPATETPAGVELLTAVVTEEVTRFGSAYVIGVPAEHVEATRASFRSALRSGGFRSATRVIDGIVHLWSDDAYEALDHDAIRSRLISVLEGISRGAVVKLSADPESTPGPIYWHTWVID
ncbi:MAG: hypothetical protein K1X38_04025 [Microthrixaceae bacterium]|nr:hypothetical protein [Microthrixaceae bacterium]